MPVATVARIRLREVVVAFRYLGLVAGCDQQLEEGTGPRRADAVVQPQQPVPGDLVEPVVQQPDGGHEVLDVRGLEELQPPELDERDVAGGELDLQQVAVVRRPHQHRLVLQPMPVLRCGQHGIDHRASLGRSVMAADQPRPPAARSVRMQQSVLFAGDAAGRHWPGRAAVAGSGSCGRAE